MKKTSIHLFTLLLLMASSCQPAKQSENTEIVKHPVRVAKIEQAVLSKPIHSTGYISTSEEIKLAFKTGGLLSQTLVKEGTPVIKGQLLATLNLVEINASVSQARTGYEKALRDHERAKRLYADSVATLEILQNSQTVLDIAEAAVKAAEFNLRYSRIHAPEKGVILKQLVKENEFVAPGYPVYILGVSDQNWIVKAGLSDRELVQVHPGDSVNLKLDAWPDQQLSATVISLSYLANPMTGTFEMEALIEPTPLKLASGFVAHLEIFPAAKEPVCLVPAESLVNATQDRGTVFVPDRNMQARPVQVSIAWVSDQKIVIREGLEDCTEVITSGAAFLKAGDHLIITR